MVFQSFSVLFPQRNGEKKIRSVIGIGLQQARRVHLIELHGLLVDLAFAFKTQTKTWENYHGRIGWI